MGAFQATINQIPRGAWLIEMVLQLLGQDDEHHRTFYSALNAHDFKMWRAVRSRSSLVHDLFGNMPDDTLFNHEKDRVLTMGIDNIKSAQVILVQKIKNCSTNCLPVYQVEIDFQFFNANLWSISNGIHPVFVTLADEIDGLGWRIEEVNTAP